MTGKAKHCSENCGSFLTLTTARAVGLLVTVNQLRSILGWEIPPAERQMGDFIKIGETGQLMLRDTVAREFVIRSNMTTGCSMLSEEEVLALVRSASLSILRLGRACGLGAQAQFISSELQNAVNVGKSKSLSAYEVCRKALELYLRENGIGKLFYIVSSRLRKVKAIHNRTRG
jgi:hypothetical protein